MKSLKTIFFIAISFCTTPESVSQTLNWGNLKKEQKNIFNINTSYDYAVTYGIGYGYQLRTKLPVVLGVEYSNPMGEEILDDFKIKAGGQIRLYQSGNFQFSTKYLGVFRRYENELSRLTNFGSELSGVVGYYKHTWYVAAECGFDKAIVTHFKHFDLYKANFPGVKDGWYQPSTGGNFYYGLQTGVSFEKSDIYLKAGKVISQDFKSTPLIPFYVQLGFNLKIKAIK